MSPIRCLLVASLLLTACGEETAPSDEPSPHQVSGDAFAFTLPGTPYGRIMGGRVSVLEAPEVETTTDDEGHFALELPATVAQATFVITADGFPEAQTKTFDITGDLERVTFQVPDDSLYTSLAGVLQLTTSPDHCQLVTTVTVVGKSIYDAGAHGEAGATVTIDPAPAEMDGPVYFNSAVIPDRTRTDTSDDGGVVIANVTPGTYTLSAHKDGVSFETITVACRAGVLVNASPPYGLQAL
ncbi:MAG: hypothetical protein KC731_32035 [Myxococcales bacterium]|nr:hypothetical protein [Myxococcales bacterium]